MSNEANGAKEALARLTSELGSPPPEGITTALTEAQLSFLADALKAEHAHRASGLGEAAEEALGLVPALARGPVRRILFA
ncbi:hypothetical protein [Streptomyces sp. NPDC048442]|uniref:hypothetical protein n=1 Tax=Streptomyces sp. NPDC048442 TaxID=3154823 RepID=UPI00342A1CF3